jgi:hypothetical protein
MPFGRMFSDNLSYSDIKYTDVFSKDVAKQKQATELYEQLLEVRTRMLDSEPDTTTGPVYCL